VVQAARQRQESIKALDIRFSLTEVVAKGSQTAPGILKPKSPVPDRETTLKSENRLVFDGERIRIEYNHPQWSMPDGKLETASCVGVFDGSVAKDFYPKGVSGEWQPQGYIQRGAELWFLRQIHILPITLAVRPATMHLCGNWLKEIEPTGRQLPIDGARCAEYIVKSPNPRWQSSYWVDAGKDYVVRRVRWERQGKLDSQLDIYYREHKDPVWLPRAWVLNRYAPEGTLLSSAKAEVVEVQSNAPIPAQQFELQFLPGTLVVDKRQTPHKDYRVQPDGSMREVSPLTHEALANSASVPQPGQSWYWQHKGLLLGILVAAVVLGCRYAWFRKKG
jgi:hypothetical protein